MSRPHDSFPKPNEKAAARNNQQRPKAKPIKDEFLRSLLNPNRPPAAGREATTEAAGFEHHLKVIVEAHSPNMTNSVISVKC
jgi:hypothetical protein